MILKYAIHQNSFIHDRHVYICHLKEHVSKNETITLALDKSSSINKKKKKANLYRTILKKKYSSKMLSLMMG